MIQRELARPWQQLDPTQYAAMSFLSRYRGGTLRAYSHDLRYFPRWCSECGVEPLLAARPHPGLYLRWMEQQGLAPATIGRRFTSVAGFYRYAVIDGRVQRTRPWRWRARECRGRDNVALRRTFCTAALVSGVPLRDM